MCWKILRSDGSEHILPKYLYCILHSNEVNIKCFDGYRVKMNYLIRVHTYVIVECRHYNWITKYFYGIRLFLVRQKIVKDIIYISIVS